MTARTVKPHRRKQPRQARATATVEDRRGHVEVTIKSLDEPNAAVALERARDLVRPRTAGR